MRTMTAFLSIGVLAATVAACSSTRQDEMAMTPRAAPMQTTVSADKLRQFTLAARKVDAVSREYPATTSAGMTIGADPREREANGRMAEAVYSEGLTVPEYNAIAMAVEQDQSLRQQYSDMWRQ